VLSGGLLSISETSTFPAVPEPSSMALISAGMCVLALVCRRWRDQQSSTITLSEVKTTFGEVE